MIKTHGEATAAERLANQITVFTTLGKKAFREDNAIGSWLRMYPRPDSLSPLEPFVNLVIHDHDDARIDVERDEGGLPLLDSLFEYARSESESRFLAYVNADIILLSDFTRAVKAVSAELGEFLMCGRRTNWHRPHPIEWGGVDGFWEDRIREEVLADSRLFNAASDYFLFTRDVFAGIEVPPMAISYYFWDAWLLWSALSRGVPVVDVTEAVLAIHQDHPVKRRSWDPGGKRNRELAKDAEEAGIDLDDATWYLTKEMELVER